MPTSSEREPERGTALERRLVPGEPELALSVAGRGPVVLFLHGVGGNRSNWTAQLEALSDGFTAVAWDARGYGESGDYVGPLRFEEFTADVERVRRFLNTPTLHLVGLSMGGVIAMDYAARHPSRVASLVLCATTTALADLPDEKIVEFLATRRAPLLAGRTPADLAPGLARALSGPAASDAALCALVHSLAALRAPMYLNALEAVTRYRPPLDLASVQVPTLVLAGERDPLVPVAHLRSVASRVPGSRFVAIPQAGHVINLEQPERFNFEVRTFLESACAREAQ